MQNHQAIQNAITLIQEGTFPVPVKFIAQVMSDLQKLIQQEEGVCNAMDTSGSKPSN